MDITLRVNSKKLQCYGNNRLCFDSIPFSGLAYNLLDNGIIHSIEVVNEGAVLGESVDCIPLPSTEGLRVSYSSVAIDETTKHVLYNDTPLTGILYKFESNGVCTSEEEYIEGFTSNLSSRYWYPNGSPMELIDHSICNPWLSSGEIKPDTKIKITSYNNLTEDIKRSSNKELEDNLILQGNKIDNLLLQRLSEQPSLGRLRKLMLVNTCIDETSTSFFKRFPILEELNLKGNALITKEIAKRISDDLPKCTVNHN